MPYVERKQASRGAAAGTEAGDLEAMVRCHEAVLGGEAVEPRVELALAELDDPMAAGADEVMVMLVAAPPVAELVGAMRDRVDDALALEQAERPVDGGEPDAPAAAAEAGVELLRGDVVLFAHELGENLDALPRRPHPRRGDQPLGALPSLLLAGHCSTG